MKIRAVQVTNFRSVVDSEPVEITDRVTVLIGKNEQGKTNSLRALVSFNPKNRYTASDLPNHLRARLEEANVAEIPMVKLWLSPDVQERKGLRDIEPSVESVEEFIVTKYFDSHYAYTAKTTGGSEAPVQFAVPRLNSFSEAMAKEAESLKVKLNTHAVRFPSFAPAKQQADAHIDQFVSSNFEDRASLENLVTTFLTSLKGLPGQDQAIQADIATTSRVIETKLAELQQALQHDPRVAFHRIIPRFVFHSTILDKVPNEVTVADFVKDPEATSKGMSSLCKVAGLSTQKIQELASTTDTGRRETFEDNYRSSISGGINEFWTQETYTIHFRIEADRLSVSVSDKSYDRRITPADRSDGFQWYLSFYAALLSEVSATDPMVLLLDNPGLELHADGQRDIKRFLEQKLPAPAQVIYVTHSSAMIDTFNLEQIRKVELRGNMQGTKVLRLEFRDDQLDLLEPVRSAVGASLVTTLISNDFNVLVEGAADKPILEGAFAKFLADQSRRIVVNGSISETGMLLPRFYKRTGLPYAVYVDGDATARDIREKLRADGIPDGNIVYAGDVINRGADFELEDTIGPGMYHEAVQRTYPGVEIRPPENAQGKCTKHYERALKESQGIGFSKRRVADVIKSMLKQPGGNEEDTQQLRQVANRIWEVLQAQPLPERGQAAHHHG